MSGLFGLGGKKEEDRARQEQARHEARQRYEPMVQEALNRLCAWAFPYGQVEGWEIGHVKPGGARVVDVRIELDGDEGEWYLKAQTRSWTFDDDRLAHSRTILQPTAVKLYDALRLMAAAD